MATHAPTGSPPLWTRGFAAILCAQMGFGFSTSAFLLTPKYMVGELGASAVEVGQVTAAFGVSSVIFLFVVGALADRGGRRRFLVAGAALMAAASLAFNLVDGLGPLLTALRFLQGAAFAMAFVAGSTLTVDEAPPERLGEAIGLFGLSMLSMNAVGPVLTEALAARLGWPAAFSLGSIGALACLVLSFFVRDRRAPVASDAPVPGLLEVVRRPEQLRIAFVVTSVGAAFGAVFTYHQPFALELGIDRVRGFFIAYAAAGIVCRLGFGHWVDRFGRRRVALITLAGYAVVVASLSELRPGTLAFFGAAFGVAHGLWYPAYNALAVEGVGENERGKVMALFLGWFNVGFAGGAIPLGWLAEEAGYPAAFLAAGGAALVAFAVLLASPERRDQAEPSP